MIALNAYFDCKLSRLKILVSDTQKNALCAFPDLKIQIKTFHYTKINCLSIPKNS